MVRYSLNSGCPALPRLPHQNALNASASVDAGSAIVMIVMGLVIVAPTALLVLAIVAGRFRNPKDDP